MHAEIIIKYYWDIFLAHICEFYPLDQNFIEKYDYELDWVSISKNRKINWDTAFLEKYERRFTWHELAWNNAIIWTIDRIEKFKKRLDWYYLGRNMSLPLDEELIQKYQKKMFVVENHPLLTEKLKLEYGLKTLSANTHDTQVLKAFQPNEAEELFKNYNFHHNQVVLYEILFLPVLEKSSLDTIFMDKFDHRQQYFFLEPVVTDIHGLTPEFEIEGENPFYEYVEDRGIFEINKLLTLKNGSLQEGPDRLFEIPRLKSYSSHPILLVSEHVKAVLEKFKLPTHIFHPVQMVHKKLKSDTNYFILHLETDTLTKDLDFTSQTYYFILKTYKSINYGKIEQVISNYKEFVETRKEVNKNYDIIGSGVKLFPDEYKLNSNLDLYSYSVHKKIIVTQFLKDELERNFPTQMTFKSAQLLNIKIEQKAWDEKSKQSKVVTSGSTVQYKQTEEVQFYYAKMERLEKMDPPFENNLSQNDIFSAKEIELNVLFPTGFKNKVKGHRLKIKEFDLLPVSSFYLQNGYADRYPETFKSVVIAENGLGDSVNLILKKESDHQLQDKLFEFFHETGEYKEI